MNILKKAQAAKNASYLVATLSCAQKNRALKAIADALFKKREYILKENKKDLVQARKLVTSGKLRESLYKRLVLDEYKINEMISGIKSLIALADPVGKTISSLELDTGLELYQVSCPLGVICFPFEARPELIIQGSSLCLKSGNAVLLKGGSEAKYSNQALFDLVKTAAASCKIPAGWVQLLETRKELHAVFGMEQYIDLLVPRGSNAFVNYVKKHTTIPVLGHTEGISNMYIDCEANLNMALSLAIDAKCQYPAACNAIENLLVHKAIAPVFLPLLKKEYDKQGVEIRGCTKTVQIIFAKATTEKDWGTEYNDLIVSIKVVDSMQEAIGFINHYGSHHSDAIVTENTVCAKQFLAKVDSACVFHNCSTRFSDGYRFGKGAEVGISTFKTHARGPVGLEGLIIYKYLVEGHGQRVASYTGKGAKKFTHKRLEKQWSP